MINDLLMASTNQDDLDPLFDYVELLMLCNRDAPFKDSSKNNGGGGVANTGVAQNNDSPFTDNPNAGSMYFKGISSSLLIGISSRLAGDFTLETYRKLFSNNSDRPFMGSDWAGAWNSTSWWTGRYGGSGKIMGSFYGAYVEDPVAPTTGIWVHDAWERYGQRLSQYRNGQEVAFAESAAIAAMVWGTDSRGLRVGRNPDGSICMDGLYAGIRLTKNVARYKGPFQIPSKVFASK